MAHTVHISSHKQNGGFINKVAIVTGASSGIGAAIAERLVEEGMRVVGIARRIERMQSLANKLQGKQGIMFTFKADITKEDEVLKAFKWTHTNVGPVYALINCAGVYHKAPLISGDTAKWKSTFDTNVLGLCVCTREAIKSMTENVLNGHIIHINSVAGHHFFPNINVYGASKFALTNLTESLRTELIGIKSGIRVSSISPGLVDTELLAKQTNNDTDFISSLPKLNPEDVAEAAMYIIKSPPHVQVQELTIRPIGDMY